MFLLWVRSLQGWEKRRQGKVLGNFRYPMLALFGSLLVASWISVWVSQIITLHSVNDALLWIWKHPVPVMLDCLVLTAFSAGIWSLCRRTWIAFCLPAVIVYGFSIINYYKMIINSSPLLYSDLSHAGSVMSIAKFAVPQLEIDFLVVGMAILLIGIGVILFFIDRRIPKVKWARMTVAGVAVAFFMVFCWTDCFEAPAAAIASEYQTQEERIAYCGSLWAFYCAYAASDRGQMEYSTEDMRSLISYLNTMNLIEDSEETVKPDVIFVMSESFFDVTRLPNVKFFKDPLPNFHRLAQSSTSGLFLSNTCNGGTGYVESEVFTGLCSNLLNEGDTLPGLTPNEVYDRIPSIARVFDENGYDMVFMHAHTPELYNRTEIYPRFGFDKLVFRDDFPETAKIKGDYLSDDSFADELISLYEGRDPEKPLLLFGITMENHQPSYEGKFNPDADIPFESDPLAGDDKAMSILRSYLTGVNDADASLGKLTDYFSKQERPVMLVFWGDHLPGMMLSNTETLYSRLGVYSSPASLTWTSEELKKILTTDYVIWTNYEEEPQPDHTESCTLLGLSVVKRLGFPLKDYYAWLDSEVAPHMLLYRPRLYVDAQGKAYAEIPEEDKQIMENYAMLMYDMIYGDNEIFASLKQTAK